MLRLPIVEIAARATDLAKRIRAFESKYEADREAGIEQEWQATGIASRRTKARC